MARLDDPGCLLAGHEQFPLAPPQLAQVANGDDTSDAIRSTSLSLNVFSSSAIAFSRKLGSMFKLKDTIARATTDMDEPLCGLRLMQVKGTTIIGVSQ
eukprot:CAMPEP_0170384446 /NCGR_PEP_ID=MMETSP0117_2-20130122/16002_1 /TAXON_ID=400756 /ORGANISM="Durinskia baltica, Strain CSIRO CS-38" /LENGTH=97 /DNA_ID=CAMNT_0010640195 /DNA_START=169 /DNA_END=458 /DNA_ORIENTATION=-